MSKGNVSVRMSKGNVSVQISPSFFSLLTIAFVVLKLTGFISWSWWLVFAPLFVPLVIVLSILLFAAILAVATK